MDNIKSLGHCTTRLRFVLNSSEGIDKVAIRNLKGVLGVVENGVQFQVIIGPNVAKLCNVILQKLPDEPNISHNTLFNNKNIFAKIGSAVFPYVTGSLQSLIPLLAGAGMIKGLVIILVGLGWLSESSGSYHVLQAAGSSVFYFLPVLLDFSAAKKLGANTFIGAAIGASLLEPNYTALLANQADNFTFLQIPIFIIDYSQSVIPILLVIVFLYQLEKYLNKVKSYATIFTTIFSTFFMLSSFSTINSINFWTFWSFIK